MPISAITIGLFIKNLAGWVWEHRRGVLIGVVLVAFLIALLVGVLVIKKAYTEQKINRTQEIINDLKKREAEIEDQTEILVEGANQKEREAFLKEEKAKAAEEAAKRIAKEENVSVDEATKNLCRVYPESELCSE